MDDFAYQGSELHIFEHARRWKSYFASTLAPYLRGNVLEAGAGIGANTEFLEREARHWTCLEPDRALLGELGRRLPAGSRRENLAGTLADLPTERRFDTILYIDVLEHIEDDSAELLRAAAHLQPGGFLAVLCPAHQWLYSPFDRRIGHFRRYDRKSLLAAAPGELRLERMIYLDAAGLLASLANRLLLRSAMPTLKQILFWDRRLVPVSRRIDGWLGYRLGKSILGVWSKPGGTA